MWDMDELLIEDKKYISSKQAAKVTGYAKDYIGQLCREGRVPARLVGRSWYVLESALQDHRFGSGDVISDNARGVAPITWEPPRYEAATEDFLPSVNRIHNTGGVLESVGEPKPTMDLQDTWKAWFDRFSDTELSAPLPEQPVETVPAHEEAPPSAEEPERTHVDTSEVNVPIRTFYQPPPEDLLPNYVEEVATPAGIDEYTMPDTNRTTRKGSRVAIRSVQISALLLAAIMATIATVGTGYLDKYILSIGPARMIAGVQLYNK